MTKTAVESLYTLRGIQQALGISRGVITGLIAEGFVSPQRGPRNEYRFSFQDVVLLRTAHQLRAAHMSPRRILQSLKRLRSTLPAELPLSGLRIRAVGDDIAVRDGGQHWAADSGQLLMDFEVAPAAAGTVTILERTPPSEAAATAGPEADAQAWFEQGEALEASDTSAAEAAYRHALALAPDHAHACLNLGALLCEAGRCAEAVALYDVALKDCPEAALLHFNRAIALEDLDRPAEALTAYEACLQADPALADAHFNAARLHEELGHAQLALRHLNAYRRLQKAAPPG